ncbi:MAG: NADH-quinone oxidoreductase subunit J [Planctomycetes bacterium]|nr:NADH-quinone oxidoreductase subunit J [Planctomycetota bacterium]
MISSFLVVSLTVAGATLAVLQRNMVRAIFGLAIALLGVALAFLELGSPFVAAMEVLIYIGGITVAMVFAIMLSAEGRIAVEASIWRRLVSAVLAAAFFAGVAYAITSSEFGKAPIVPDDVHKELWSVETLGRDLLDRFNVVFELLSIVLLVAILGAIAIATREKETSPEDSNP